MDCSRCQVALRRGPAGGHVATIVSVTEIHVATLRGPSGPLAVATTEHGVVAAAWQTSEDALVVSLRRRLGDAQAESRPGGAAARMLDRARPVLAALLAGEDAPARDVPVDLADRPVFDQRVLAAVRDVGWGETASYGELARRVGAPRAARAVGGALGRNPVALLVPCHRIIASDGTIGGYGGDGWTGRAEALEQKRALLAREGVTARFRAG